MTTTMLFMGNHVNIYGFKLCVSRSNNKLFLKNKVSDDERPILQLAGYENDESVVICGAAAQMIEGSILE